MTDDTKFIEKHRKIIHEHNKLFGGHFMYHVPDGTLFYENNEEAYFTPDKIRLKELESIIKEDIINGINSIPERFKENRIIYEEGVDY
jgi:hypothetical protein